MSTFDLTELKFRVNTDELKDAATSVANLATSVDSLKNSLKNIPKANLPGSGGSGSSGCSGPGSTKGNKGLKDFNKLMEDLTQLQKDLVDGFSRGESAMLRQARALNLSQEELKTYGNKIKEVGNLFKDPFDSAIGSVRAVRQEFDKLNTRAELMQKGIFLSTKQLEQFSRISTEIEGKLFSQGKKKGASGSFEGADLKEYNALLEKSRTEFLQVAVASNNLRQAEEIRLKESKAAIEAQAQAQRELQKSKQDEFNDFVKAEHAKLVAIERTVTATEQMIAKTELLRQGYSRGEATAIVSGLAQGIDRGTIDNLIKAQRDLASAGKVKSHGMDEGAKSAREMAKAEQYLIDIERRLDAALEETNKELGERHTDKIVKVKNALTVLGKSTDQAGEHFTRLNNKIHQVASKEQAGKIRDLGRAMSVQMGDVGISLASGMNPLLVMIQQGDQIRDAVVRSQLEGAALQKAMNESIKQIATSTLNTAKIIGGFFVSAVKDSGNAIINLIANATGLNKVFDEIGVKLAASNGRLGSFAKGIEYVAIAFRTLAGVAIVGMIAMFVAMAVALYKSVRESDELTKSLALSGGAMGMNSAAAYDYAYAMTNASNTTSDALEVLKEMGKAGNLVSEDIQMVTDAAIALETWGGQAIAETVKQFSDLKKDPVDALFKVAKATGMVTVETLRSVEELEKQGKTFDAQKLAVQAYADVTKIQVDRMKEEYSSLGKAIIQAGHWFSQFWSNLKNATPEQERIDNLIRGIERLKQTNANDPQIAEWQATLDELENKKKIRDMEMEGARIRAQAVADEEELKKIRTDNLSKAEKYTTEINKQLNLLTRLKDRGDTKGAAEVEKNILRISEEYKKAAEKKEKLTDAQKEALRIEEKSKSVLADVIKLTINQQAKTDELTEAEKRHNQIIADTDYAGFSEQKKLAIRLYIEYAKAIELARKAHEREEKALEEFDKGLKQYDEAITKANEKMDDYVVKLREVTESGEAANARLKVEADLLWATDDARKRSLLTYDAQIKKEKALREAEKERDTNIKDGDKGHALRKYGEAVALIQKQYESEMRGINTVIANDFQVKMRDEFENIKEDISDSLVTAMFKGAKEGAQKLRDVVVRVLQEKVTIQVDAVVNTLMQEGLNFLGGVTGQQPGSTTGALGQYGSMVSGANTLYQKGSAIYQGYQSGGMTGAWSSLTGGSSAVTAGAYGSTTSGAGLVSTTSGSPMAGVASTTTSTGGSSAGAGAGMYAIYAALIYMGYQQAQKDYAKGFDKSSARNAGDYLGDRTGGASDILFGYQADLTTGLEKLGMSEKWASILGGSTPVGRWFGLSKPQIKAQGISGTFGAGGFAGENYADIQQKGGYFRSDVNSRAYAPMTDEVKKAMNDVAKGVYDGVSDYSKKLGLATDQLSSIRIGLTFELTSSKVDELSKEYGEDLSRPFSELSEQGKRIAASDEFAQAVKEDSENNLKALTTAANKYGDVLVESFAEQVKPFAAYGETTSETIKRLAETLTAVNDIFKLTNLTMYDASLTGADSAVKFTEFFGSVDNMTSTMSTYYDTMFSEEEKLKNTTNALADVFSGLGVEIPSTTEGFKALVTAASAAGDAELVADLIKIAPAFKQIKDAADELRNAVISGFSGVADQLLNEDDLKNFRIGEVITQLADAGIVVTAEMVKASTASQVYAEGLAYFNAGMYDKANALIGVVDILSSIWDEVDKVKPEDVTKNFIGQADKFLIGDDLKNFKIGTVIRELEEAGIVVTEEMVRNSNNVTLFAQGLAFFNAGMFKEADALLNVVDTLSEINPEGFFTEADHIQLAIDYLTESMEPLKDAMQAIEDEFGDVVSAMEEINHVPTLVESWQENKSVLEQMKNDLESLIPTKALTDLEKLAKTIEILGSVTSEITSINDRIFDVRTSKNSKDSVNLLKAEEARLLGEISTSTDPAGAARQLADVSLRRIQMEAALKTEISDNEKKALDSRIETLEKEIDLANELNNAISEMKSFVAELRYGDLSALNPTMQLGAAKNEYERILGLANSGDKDALGKLQGSASSYLQEAQGYYGGATSGYASVYSTVLGNLDGFANKPMTDSEVMQAQLTSLQTLSENSTKDIDTSAEQLAALEIVRDALIAREVALTEEKDILAEKAEKQIEVLGTVIEKQQEQIKQQFEIWTAYELRLDGIQERLDELAGATTLESALPT